MTTTSNRPTAPAGQPARPAPAEQGQPAMATLLIAPERPAQPRNTDSSARKPKTPPIPLGPTIVIAVLLLGVLALVLIQLLGPLWGSIAFAGFIVVAGALFWGARRSRTRRASRSRSGNTPRSPGAFNWPLSRRRRAAAGGASRAGGAGTSGRTGRMAALRSKMPRFLGGTRGKSTGGSSTAGGAGGRRSRSGGRGSGADGSRGGRGSGGSGSDSRRKDRRKKGSAGSDAGSGDPWAWFPWRRPNDGAKNDRTTGKDTKATSGGDKPGSDTSPGRQEQNDAPPAAPRRPREEEPALAPERGGDSMSGRGSNSTPIGAQGDPSLYRWVEGLKSVPKSFNGLAGIMRGLYEEAGTHPIKRIMADEIATTMAIVSEIENESAELYAAARTSLQRDLDVIDAPEGGSTHIEKKGDVETNLPYAN